MKGRIFLFGVSLVLLMSCVKKVVITRTYIINRNWSNTFSPANRITIYKLHLADSSRPIIVDSIFRSSDGRRRRSQVFYTKRDTIGALELNSWYAFEGLTSWHHIYFVYVDSTGRTRWVRILPPWVKPF